MLRRDGLRDLLDEAREGRPRDEEDRVLLVLPDLPQRHRPRPVPVPRLLRPARRRPPRGAPRGLRGAPRDVGPGGAVVWRRERAADAVRFRKALLYGEDRHSTVIL